MSRQIHANQGFTLVEVLVIMPITVMIIAGLMSVMFKQYASINDITAKLNLKLEGQAVMIAIQDDLQYANNYLSVTDPALTDSYSSDYTSLGTANRLIVDNPSSTSTHRDPARKPVYIDTVGCVTTNIDENPFASDNIIFFIKNGSLYKRTLILPDSVPQCNVNFQKHTCPLNIPISTSCPSWDRRMSDHATALNITYFIDGGAITTNPTQASSVKISLTLQDKVNAEVFTDTQSITVKRFN